MNMTYYEGLAMEAEKAFSLSSPAGWSLRQPGGGAESSESIKVNGLHPSLEARHPGAPE